MNACSATPQTDPRLLATPARYAKMTMAERFLFPPHVQQFQRTALRLLTDPICNRIIVEAPVRHGKSEFWSHVFPSWYLSMFPDNGVLLSTYSSDFSAEMSGRCRDHLDQWGHLTGLRLDPAYHARDYFKVLGRNGRMAGIGTFGAVSGKGFNLIIADDLVKDQQEANSPASRNSLARWFVADLLTRCEPGAKIVVVMSRRHPDDLTGRLLAMNPDLPPALKWHSIKFKAIGDDGAALWPGRYNLEQLRSIEQEFAMQGASYLWSCLYQQDPRGDPAACEWPDDYFAGIFYDNLPEQPYRLKIMALDPSMGKNAKTGDYPALLHVLMDCGNPPQLWVDDAFMRVVPLPMVEAMSVAWLEQKKPDSFAIEVNGFQERVAADIIRMAGEKGLSVPVSPHVDTEDKEVRLRMELGPLLAQHQLHFRNTQANRLVVKQLQEFPTGAHDDGPDALAIAVREFKRLLHGRRGPPAAVRYRG